MDAERGFQFGLLAVAVVLTTLLVLPYLTVVLAAVLLAYLLDRPHEVLAARVGDRAAAFGLIAGTLVVVLFPFVLLTDAVLQGVDDLLELLRERSDLSEFEGVRSLLESVFGIDLDGGASVVELVRQGKVADLVGTALDVFGGVSTTFAHLTVLLFVWYYLLKDGDRFLGWVGTVIPLSDELQSELFERADKVMYVVVIGNFVVAVADGLLVSLGLWLVGFPNVLFWAFISVFMALVPLVGTMLIWVPAAAYLVVTGDAVAGAFLLVYCVAVVGSIDNLLRPFLGAPDVGLEPGLFIVGVLTGLSLFGVMGVFYGPVLLVMTKVVFETVGRDLRSADA